MTRTDGFAVMDVSTDIVNDPKFRHIQRTNPDKVGLAFLAYISLLGECWKAGRRVTILDAWPAFVPYDKETAGYLREVGLIDSHGMIPAKAWNGWFKAASERRDKARERWRRANAKREQLSTNDSVSTASEPRGNSAATASTVPYRTAPSVPTVPSVPSEDPYDAPETEALSWLAHHGVALSETNGFRRKLIDLVERFGTTAVIGKFDRLSSAGVLDGDARGFVFGASDALYPKADLKALDREERAEDDRAAFNRGVERTQRLLREVRGEG